MKIKYALMLAAGMFLAKAGYSTETMKTITVGSGSASWQMFLVNNVGTNFIDCIELVRNDWLEAYIMKQTDVSPTYFSLTYNTLKDAFLRTDVVNLTVDYESTTGALGGKLYRVQLTHR